MNRIARYLRSVLACVAVVLFLRVGIARGDEKLSLALPPPPPQFFNDFAHVTQPATQQQLNEKLHQFEADTSSQVVVAIYPTLPDGQEINQYCTHLFQSWHIGQKGKDNGIGLFVFTQSRKMFIVTGYGMEGPLPDATCEAIIENDIKPHFKTGDYDGGLQAGVDAILAATRGEYHGNGHAAGDSKPNSQGFPLPLIVGLVVIVMFIAGIWQAHHTNYSRDGRQSGSWGGFLLQVIFGILSNVTIGGGGGGSGDGSGGGWDRGGGGGGGGGGFSGGGGSTGGGGAGGSW